MWVARNFDAISDFGFLRFSRIFFGLCMLLYKFWCGSVLILIIWRKFWCGSNLVLKDFLFFILYIIFYGSSGLDKAQSLFIFFRLCICICIFLIPGLLWVSIILRICYCYFFLGLVPFHAKPDVRVAFFSLYVCSSNKLWFRSGWSCDACPFFHANADAWFNVFINWWEISD